MPIPTHYFYNMATSEEMYGLTPSGTLSVDRLLANKPCWRKSGDTVILKKKTLIINDKDAAMRDPNQRIVVEERLKALQHDGFNVYAHKNGTLTPFESYSDLLPVPIKPVYDKIITAHTIRQLNLSHDDILILNTDEMARLIIGDDDDWLKLPSFIQADLSKSNISGESLKRFLLEHADEIETLNLSGCINLQDASFDGIKLHNLRSLILSAHVRETNLSIKSFLQLIGTLNLGQLTTLDLSYSKISSADLASILIQATQLETLHLPGCENLTDSLPKDLNLASLKTLDLRHSNITSENLASILNKVTQLETLNLSFCKNLTDRLPEDLNLASLTTLDLSYSKISSADLASTLIQATQLETLHLPGCENLTDSLPKDLNLASLKTLDLRHSNITSENLASILNKVTQLETLNLSNCKNLTDRLPEDLNPVSLKTLDLSYSKISSADLGSILIQATQLETLNLSNCNNLTGILTEELKLASLKTLDLSYSKISSADLGRILKHATQLETLNLSFCKNLTGILPDNLNLASLKTLDLSYSEISSENLGRILKQATQLETLNLSNCKNLTDRLPEDLNLASLKTLGLSSTNIRSDNLGHILKQATQLETLNLSNCKNLTDRLPEDLNLASLKTLGLSSTNIRSDNLGHILKLATQLETLNLSFCKNLTGILTEELNLTSLKTLDLQHSEISSESLGRILKHATQLETLDLSNCNNLTSILTEELNLASLKTLGLRFSNITSDNLGRILKLATQLETLDLSFCKNLTGILTEELNLTSLKTLDLQHSEISSESLGRILKHATQLETLDLSSCENLTDKLPDNLNLTSLKTLDLQHSKISSESLGSILKHATQLESLNLYGCEILPGKLPDNLNLASLKTLDLLNSKISGESLGSILKHVTQLETLDLSGCENLTDKLPDNLDLASLKKLDLLNSKISGENLGRILNKATQLESLNLARCKNLTGSLPDNLNLASLKNLVLTNSNITSENLGRIIEQATKLKQIYLNGCSISSDLIKKIKTRNPNIFILIDTKIMPASQNLHVSSNTAPPKSASAPPKSASSAPQRPYHDKQSLDADTTPNPDQKFHVERLFHPGNGAPEPKISHYRLQAFHTCSINNKPCDINNAFGLSNTTINLELDNENIPILSGTDLYEQLNKLPTRPHQYYGKQRIKLTNAWQPLPSLSPDEKMTRFHLSQNVDVDIQYSKRDNLYYIRNKQGSSLLLEPVDVDFIIQVPEPCEATLHEDIKNKISEYQTFGCKKVNLTQPNPTGNDYLNALNEQKVGACRHRSFLFKFWMQKNHPNIPVRIINNVCHSFIELKNEGKWYRYDLGGYPAQLSITRSDLSEPSLVTLTTDGDIKIDLAKEYFPTVHHETKPTEITPYVHQLLTNGHRATLIKADQPNGMTGLRYQLQKQCKNTSRACFYIHSPEDLICHAPWIQRNDANNGIIRKGPGGKLHDFLTAHANDETKPLLIVNYEQFSPADIVRFNALLDTERKADGTPLPDNMQIIGLINPAKPGAYDGADFYSRFDHHDTCALSETQFDIPPVITHADVDNQQTQRIELYGGSRWKEQLLGHWSLNGQALTFNEGELSRACREGKTHLDLSNAPWNDPEFTCFLQTAMLNHTIEIQGKPIQLPENLSLSKSQGYAFEQAQDLRNTSPDEPKALQHVLNPGLLSSLFGQYHCQKKAVYQQDGLIKTHAGQSLSLYVSHALSDADWARILDECRTYKVTLALSLAHGVTLPPGFNIDCLYSDKPANHPWLDAYEEDFKTAYIHTTDIDATLASMQSEYDLIIDVSEVDPADLIMKINAQFDEPSLNFHFDERIGALRQALQENKNVILKGHFSQDMQYALSDVLFQRQHSKELTSRLRLIGTEPDLFSSVPAFTHQVTLEDKKQALPTGHALTDELITTKSLAQLKAIARYPSKDTSSPWMGMETLPPKAMPIHSSIDLSNVEENARVFNQNRLHHVQRALSQSPFVVLTGMSGVGKTSFIKNVWKQNTGSLHIGKDNIKAWAKDKTPGLKTLFIDEANISSRQWSEFEGLFNKKPSILVGNEYIELTPEHKVIFACNPLSYGGERQMPSLFKRHGNSVLFDPMTPDYIYHEILKPVLSESNHPEAIAKPILEIANYLTQHSQDNVLITPRELAAMALFTQRFCATHPEQDPADVAKYYARSLSRHFVPDTIKSKFDESFVDAPVGRMLPQLLESNFLSTSSNLQAQEALDDFLTLRDYRQNHQGNSIQQYGGLGGLILEGEPGIGKTELVAKTLVARGLVKGCLSHEHPQHGVFYIIPVSMMFEEKKKLLLKAFHEGAVVVMDEINSAPMMESLLNDLLMGQTPDGKPPEKPGFLLIGTQNPVTMAGRAKASSALQHRMQTVILPDYNPEDMTRILQHKGLPEQTAQAMVDEYLEKRQAADRNPELYKLCFRDLLKRAEQELHSIKNEVLTKLESELERELETLQYQIGEELKEIQLEHPSSTTTQCARSIDSTLTSIKSLIVNSKQTLNINTLEQQINDRLSEGIKNLTNVPNPSMWEHVKQLFVNFGTFIANHFRKHDNKVKLSDIGTVKEKISARLADTQFTAIKTYKTQMQELLPKTEEEPTPTPKP